jgi:predicted CxxxxCH...CXXCH cytochrome family protein
LKTREPSADDNQRRCASCHGDSERGGDSLQRAAPPSDMHGARAPGSAGVGPHLSHVYGSDTHGPVPCAECHIVPEQTDTPGHADDALPAEVRFGSLASTRSRAPRYDREQSRCSDTYCHQNEEPSWSEPRPSSEACGSCHGLPPPLPHPQNPDCSQCHGGVVAEDDRAMREPARHVDGNVDLSGELPCSSCHGSLNPAPPQDLTGGTDPALPGVGAHQVHLAGSERARAVRCNECHRVPEQFADPGHADTPPPAEVIFSGAASAFGGSPAYTNGSCQNVSCHGGYFPRGVRSGGTTTEPLWTRVDGTQATCGSCHGLPPPPPHPYGNLNPVCSACHENIAPDNQTFIRPELHVDGVVTYDVP